MKKRYLVDLSEQERNTLLALTQKGQPRARTVRRAQILLLADENRTDQAIAQALHVGASTVERTRRRFVEEGLEAALSERARRGAARKLDAKQEAYLIALACSAAPNGKKRWTMQLLADRMVALDQVDCLSDETVRRTLKKTRLSPG